MEMPIQLIMTLFVVLIVGSLVILFSQNLLFNAEQGLPTLGNYDKTKQGTQILEVDSLSNAQIAFLVDECYSTRFGKVFKDETCFIVHSVAQASVDNDDINAKVSTEGILGEVDEEDVKTVFINWNFFNTQVDVTS